MISPTARTEIFYDATNETCYKPDEIKRIADKTDACRLAQRDLKTYTEAYNEYQKRGCHKPWYESAWVGAGIGFVLGAVIVGMGAK